MVEFSMWDILRNLLLAVRWTVVLSVIAFVGGGVLGMILLVVRLAKVPGAQRGVALFVQIFQGTPLLMQLFLAYFGIALFGIDTSAWTAAALALTLHASAYLTEIWRGCVNAIPKGQWEASTSLAMNLKEQLMHIILPQAGRIAIAPTVGFMVQVVKGTALASVGPWFGGSMPRFDGYSLVFAATSALQTATVQFVQNTPLVVLAGILVIYLATLGRGEARTSGDG